jgi:hypothetical protein
MYIDTASYLRDLASLIKTGWKAEVPLADLEDASRLLSIADVIEAWDQQDRQRDKRTSDFLAAYPAVE